MKLSIIITKEELARILDSDDYERGDFKKHHRHNGGYQDIIFKRNGKNYLLTYLWFEYDGIYLENNYQAFEVVEVEKVVKYWKIVDDGLPEPKPIQIPAPPANFNK